MSTGFVRTKMEEARPAPVSEKGVANWLQKNLFSSVLNSILSVFGIIATIAIAWKLLEFALFTAVWSGADRTACATEAQSGVQPNGWFGACWPYIADNMKNFIYGRYPPEELWRVNIVFVTLLLGTIALVVPQIPYKRLSFAFMLGVFPVLGFILLTGGDIGLGGFLVAQFLGLSGLPAFWVDYAIVTGLFCLIAFGIAKGSDSDPTPGIRNVLIIFGALAAVMVVLAIPVGLEHVETNIWGGLLVTLVIAIVGIVASLPIGILLALGRRSDMPAVKLLCVIFIEFWRGVPLVTVLFMSSVMLPLFLPSGVEFDKLLRVLIGVALFSAAYMAEVVRGGIQALPKGQYEGAMALGLSYWQMMQKIILPQALKLVIPGIVNTFIGLFKDTSLVGIVGIFDFLFSIRSSFSNSTWATPVQALTGFLFAAIVYFIFCFGMSRYSIYMERKLDTGHRS